MIKLLIKGQYRLFTARFTHQRSAIKQLLATLLFILIPIIILFSLTTSTFLMNTKTGHGTRIFNLLMKEIKVVTLKAYF